MYQRPKTRAEAADRATSRTPPPRPDYTDQSPAKPAAKDEAVIEVQGVYIISVAARILDMHPQTLRKYERLGLINPGRTIGMLRLYSTEDIK